jgi:hypothetical protein
VWHEVENEVPRTLDLAAAETVFEDKEAVVVLKSLLAMHLVRGRHTQLLWADWITEKAKSGHLASILEMANDLSFLAGLHRDLTGLHPVGGGALEYTRSQLMSELERKFGMGGDAFVEQLLLQYRTVLDYLLPRGIQIGVPRADEYLIGDNPAATYDHDRRAAGLRAGANLGTADTILLPLGPGFVLAAGGTNAFIDVPPHAVETIN